MKRILFLGFAVGVFLLSVQPLWALTTAGTVIENRARADYVLGGSNYTAYSATTQTPVAELVDVSVASAMGATTAVTAPLPTSGELLYFAVTNAGNSTEEFALTADPAVAGNDFDPDNPVVAMDAGSIGSYDGTATDVPILTPISIPAETTIYVWVIADILDTPLNPGDTGRVTLEAVHQNAPISTTPGDVYAGAGPGATDLVLGASGGYGNATGAYVILRTTLILDKTVASIAGTVAGIPVTDPIPGAVITYQLDVIVSGTGTAFAVTVADPIPVNTTYVPDSITLDIDGPGPVLPVGLTDSGADYPADRGEFTGTEVRVRLGDLVAGTQTITFQVTID